MSRSCLPPGPEGRRPGRRPALRRPLSILAPAALGAALLFCGACAGPRPTVRSPESVAARPLPVDAQTPADPATAALIAPYQETVDARMGEVLAIAPVALERGSPEGPLGNLIADIVLERARAASGLPIDACLLNDGGLRISWPAGPITLGLVYELMPFDNTITLLRLSANQMRALVDEIASHGGEPLSGMGFVIERGAPGGGASGGGAYGGDASAGDAGGRARRAVDLLVGGEPVGERDYWLATNSYLADGGGGMETLWAPLEKIALPLLIRDAIADACRAHGARGATGEVGRLPVPSAGRVVARRGGER